MAFAFAAGERVDLGARRLAREGVERIVAVLGAPGDGRADGDEAVHDARRTLKRLRALVRLVGGAIGADARAANVTLRDAARGLASARDAAVVAATFDALAGDDPAAASLRAALGRARARASAPDVPGVLERVRGFDAGVERWRFSDGGWSALEPGVHGSYRAGRKALARARVAPESTVLHDLRKRCKDLQFQLALLRPVFPHVLGGYHEASSELGELLGQDHDLALLEEALRRRRKREAAPWLEQLTRRRVELRDRALPLAEKLWFDRPRRWTRRLAWFWTHP